MSKFKIGDRVRIVCVKPGRAPEQEYIGKEFEIETDCGTHMGEQTWGGGELAASKPWRWLESELELITTAGPIRTRTVTEIVPGTYGDLLVGVHDASAGLVQLELLATWRGFMRDASELRALSTLASQLADALEAE